MNAETKHGAPAGVRQIASNRKARRDFHVLEKLEAGMELRGTEVKSIRAGKVSLDEAFARIEDGQVFLYGMHVQPYEHGNVHNHDPVRPRRMLLHSREIHRLLGQTTAKGNTLVPLRLYLRRGVVKVELGLCRGKQRADKREDLKRRTADREAERAIAARIRR